MSEEIWITKDGKQVEIGKMTNAHLLNAIRYFRPIKNKHKERWKMLEKEAIKREILEGPEEIESRFDILDI